LILRARAAHCAARGGSAFIARERSRLCGVAAIEPRREGPREPGADGP